MPVNVIATAFKSPFLIEITASGALRRKIGGDDDVDEPLKLASVACNLYFDRKHHFSVGAD
jgi:hypothetical protein